MMKDIVSWNISSYRPVIIYRSFGGACCTLYFEDVGRNFLRASLNVYHNSRRHNPEDNYLLPKLLCVYIARVPMKGLFVPDANHLASDSKVATTSLAVAAFV
jgi:hypothetical protein